MAQREMANPLAQFSDWLFNLLQPTAEQKTATAGPQTSPFTGGPVQKPEGVSVPERQADLRGVLAQTAQAVAPPVGMIAGMGRLQSGTRQAVEEALGRMTEAERAWLTGPKTKIAAAEIGTVPETSRAVRMVEKYGTHAETARGTGERGAMRFKKGADPEQLPATAEEEARHLYQIPKLREPGPARDITIELYAQPEMRPIVQRYAAEGRAPESILRELAANAHRGVLSGPGRPDINPFDAMYQRALESPTVRRLYENLVEELRAGR